MAQLNMYVAYYRDRMMTEGDNAPIGILLCTAKNDAMVKLTLPENSSQILASQYELYLPSEKVLKQELDKLAQAQEKFKENNES